MNIESVTKRLFHSFHLFVDINRLYFDNIEIAPIFLKTRINKIQNRIEIFGYILRFSNFILNRFDSKSNRFRIDSNRFSVAISQSRPCLNTTTTKIDNCNAQTY
jgi:hypothetical protein